MGGVKVEVVFWWFSLLFLGKRTRDFAFVSSCYGRSGKEICTGYAMAASGRMQYDYKQTNKRVCVGATTRGEDDNPHEQSVPGCGLPGRIYCWCSNPKLQSKTSPLALPTFTMGISRCSAL